jgi:hypothetical protein
MRLKTSLVKRMTFWLARRLPHCDAISATLSEALERPLTLRERTVRRLHFLCCNFCRRYEQQLYLLRRSVSMRASA